MSSEQKQFYSNMSERITAIQKKLRNISDDELMRIHESIYDEPDEKRDAALMTATYKEVQRRFVASGWFWRRLFRRYEYEKWVNHTKKTEQKATEELISILGKYDDPTSQEAVRRLKQH